MKTIALTMIVKNEERCIARCLDSVAPWVDEMIVVDTGSTDRTVEIARAHGATVYHRRWTNDFAAARNAALAKSKADWNLILDADEWLVSGGEYLQWLRTSSERMVHHIRVDSALGNQDNTLQTSHYIPRIIPRGVRYKGQIHEQPNHRLPFRKSDLVVLHDGYMPAQLQGKRGRNMELLLQEVKNNPTEPYYHYQLGKEYDIQNDHAKALEYYQTAHRMFPGISSWHHDMIIRMLECMKILGKIEDAMIFASDEMPNWQHSPDFHVAVGHILLEQMNRRPDQGPSLLPMIEECWLSALRVGDSPDLPGTIKGQGSFIAAQKLWALYDARKDYENAEKYDAMYRRLYQEYKDTLNQASASNTEMATVQTP